MEGATGRGTAAPGRRLSGYPLGGCFPDTGLLTTVPRSVGGGFHACPGGLPICIIYRGSGPRLHFPSWTLPSTCARSAASSPARPFSPIGAVTIWQASGFFGTCCAVVPADCPRLPAPTRARTPACWPAWTRCPRFWPASANNQRRPGSADESIREVSFRTNGGRRVRRLPARRGGRSPPEAKDSRLRPL